MAALPDNAPTLSAAPAEERVVWPKRAVVTAGNSQRNKTA